MPHSASTENVRGFNPPHAPKTHAYLVGGGIASLAAAADLIHHAHVPASQIHILESSSLPGGSMDGSGAPSTGYIIRGGRMLNFSYICLYNLLSSIPSLKDPNITVLDEIATFNTGEGNKTHANARVVVERMHGMGPGIADATEFQLSGKDRVELVKMTIEGEDRLVGKKIDDFFDEEFFQSNFWIMWATMFAFQRWHSAMEFRRYLHRFLHELPRINTLAGVDRTPYNQYDSIILPAARYLQNEGVEFKYDTTVTGLSYADSQNITAEEIHITEAGSTGIIHVHENDIVLVTLGSMTASSSLGTNTTAPPSPPPTDPSWTLWESLSHDNPLFGNPFNFSTRIPESQWESFTVTLNSPELLDRITAWTQNAPGTGALMTLKDSDWLMSIVVPHQPHFLNQPPDTHVFWGFGLHPTCKGNFVEKPMSACSGAEILTELLLHLEFPTQPILEHATTIPCLMPYITSQFLTRAAGDRPAVIPRGSTNLAFVGQFVEIPRDVVFTVEYSVRGAQMAVRGLMGLATQPPPVYRGEHDVKVLARALKVMMGDGPAEEKALPQGHPIH